MNEVANDLRAVPMDRQRVEAGEFLEGLRAESLVFTAVPDTETVSKWKVRVLRESSDFHMDTVTLHT